MSDSANTLPPTKLKKKAPRSAFKKGDARINLTGRPVSFKHVIREMIGEHGEEGYKLLWRIAQGKVRYEEVEEKTRPLWTKAFSPEFDETLPSHQTTITEEKRAVRVPNFQVRADCAKFIIEHLNGKATQPIEANTTTSIALSFDIDRLSDEALEALVSAHNLALPEGEVVDADTRTNDCAAEEPSSS